MMQQRNFQLPQRLTAALILAVCAALACRLLLNAWVSEDAFFTFRVVDNFLHGYGLRWNVDERVQVFTHPLWMLLHIPVVAVMQNAFIASIALSLACMGLAIHLLLKMTPSPLTRVALLLLPLLLSKTIAEYTTSGLENALSTLLLIIFWHSWYARQPLQKLVFVSALLLLCRFDHLLFIAPAMLYRLWEEHRSISPKLLISSWPLAGWLAFSVFYYGFALPNTKYAKLGVGNELPDRIDAGIAYLQAAFYHDMAGMGFATAALAFTTLYALCSLGRNKQIAELLLPISGIGLSLLYICYIGGDYMVGRFLMIPIISAIILLLRLHSLTHNRLTFAPSAIAMALLCLQASPYAIKGNNLYDAWEIRGHIICDDHKRYESINSLIYNGTLHWQSYAENAKLGRQVAQESSQSVVEIFNKPQIAIYSYYAGPTRIVLENHGITDALVARLPMSVKRSMVPGHYRRIIPPEYITFRQTGDDSTMPPDLQAYNRKLHQIIRGDLLSLERLKSIAQLQLGMYDPWLESYIASVRMRMGAPQPLGR